MTMKTCTKCKCEKLLSEFHRHKNTKDQLAHECKSCACARAAAWVKANPIKHAITAAAQRKKISEARRIIRVATTQLLAQRTMKKCTKCGEEKALADFGRVSKTRGGGHRPDCKKCSALQTAAWVKAHPEKRAAITARYYINNIERFSSPEYLERARIRMADRSVQSKKKAAERLAAWKKAHRAKCNASLADYKFRKVKATPTWANEFFIEEIYDLAQRRTKMLGVPWEVDHIIPLRSKTVCGLHVEHNLQVIPAVLNKQKGNRYCHDVPVVQHIKHIL